MWVLDKARHDDEDDEDENMNYHFLDIMRDFIDDMLCAYLSSFDGICAELKYRVKRHAQYYLNDRPYVERDEH